MNAWQPSFATLAGVSATLSGLLFVALSVARTSTSPVERHALLFVSKRSFFDFISVMIFALVYQLPSISMHTTSYTLVGQIATRATWHVNQWLRFSGSSTVHGLLREKVMPVLITAMLGIACAASFVASPQASTVAYVAMLLLLFTACTNAWQLLIR